MIVVALLAAIGFGIVQLARGEAAEPAADAVAPSSASVSSAGDAQLATIAREVARSVVRIDAAGLSRSGVIFDAGGRVLTAAAVVGDADTVSVVLADGRRYDARVIAVSEESRLAVVALSEERLPAAGLARSEPLIVGQSVAVVGSPMGESPEPALGTLTALSAGRGALGGLLATDVSSAPGRLGGALADSRGRVIGVVVSDGVSDGQTVAMPIRTALQTAQQLVSRTGRPLPELPFPDFDGLPRTPEELDRLLDELERSFGDRFRPPETPGG